MRTPSRTRARRVADTALKRTGIATAKLKSAMNLIASDALPTMRSTVRLIDVRSRLDTFGNRIPVLQFEVIRRVVFPAALSGIMASVILAMSRAVGETMAVVLAMGFNPKLTINPLEQGGTMAAFIAQITSGDTPQDSLQFKSLFAVGLVLFAITLGLNLISNRIVARYRNRYS